jgi:hypothetical protein
MPQVANIIPIGPPENQNGAASTSTRSSVLHQQDPQPPSQAAAIKAHSHSLASTEPIAPMFTPINPAFLPALTLPAPERIHAEGNLGRWTDATRLACGPTAPRSPADCGLGLPVRGRAPWGRLGLVFGLERWHTQHRWNSTKLAPPSTRIPVGAQCPSGRP